VLLVQNNGKYGAFGISSNPDLMTKDFQFDRLIIRFVKQCLELLRCYCSLQLCCLNMFIVTF
jgi:hypothetical protein